MRSRVTEEEGGTQQQLEIHMSKEGEDATSTEGTAGKWNKDPTGQGRRQKQESEIKTPPGRVGGRLGAVEDTAISLDDETLETREKRNAAARPQSNEQSL